MNWVKDFIELSLSARDKYHVELQVTYKAALHSTCVRITAIPCFIKMREQREANAYSYEQHFLPDFPPERMNDEIERCIAVIRKAICV